MSNHLLDKTTKLALIGAVLVSNISLMPYAEAKSKGNGNKQVAGQGQKQKNWQNNASLKGYWDNDRDQNRFRDWLNRTNGRSYSSSYNVPSSVLTRNDITRAEFEALPPGIQKKVMRGKSIPPGLQPGHRMNRNDLSRVSPISDALLDALGLPRDRYSYNDGRRVGRLDEDAIIYNPASGIIFDVLRGIF